MFPVTTSNLSLVSTKGSAEERAFDEMVRVPVELQYIDRTDTAHKVFCWLDRFAFKNKRTMHVERVHVDDVLYYKYTFRTPFHHYSLYLRPMYAAGMARIVAAVAMKLMAQGFSYENHAFRTAGREATGIFELPGWATREFVLRTTELINGTDKAAISAAEEFVFTQAALSQEDEVANDDEFLGTTESLPPTIH